MSEERATYETEREQRNAAQEMLSGLLNQFVGEAGNPLEILPTIAVPEIWVCPLHGEREPVLVIHNADPSLSSGICDLCWAEWTKKTFPNRQVRMPDADAKAYVNAKRAEVGWTPIVEEAEYLEKRETLGEDAVKGVLVWQPEIVPIMLVDLGEHEGA